MRILRPFSRYTKKLLVEPCEERIFANLAFDKPLIPKNIKSGIARMRGLYHAFAESASGRGWFDGHNYAISNLFPVPEINTNNVYTAFQSFEKYTNAVKHSTTLAICFNAAIRQNHFRMMAKIKTIMDRCNMLEFTLNAVECGNIIALKLILRWHDEVCEKESCMDNDFVSRLSRSAGETINLAIVKYLADIGTMNLEYAFYGLLENRCWMDYGITTLSNIRQIAKFLIGKGVVAYDIAETVVTFGDTEIVKMMRPNIIRDRLTLEELIGHAREANQMDILHLLLSWQPSTLCRPKK